MHRVNFILYLLCLFTFVFLYSHFSMELLKFGSLNINGGRDRKKLAMISEFVKGIDIVFLQETHTSNDNETRWGMWREGKYALSHGTNTSAGVAILFSKNLNVNILIVIIVKGRTLLIKVEFEGTIFVLINVYAPNNGHELVFFYGIENSYSKN